MSGGGDRVINLLGHYRDRLRRKGDYSEELDYLVTILESPFTKEYLNGKMSTEDTHHFNVVTSEVISALEEEEEERHLSPETQRKRLLKRRQSLRALKLAVTPQSSPHITPKTSKTILTSNPLLQHQSSATDSPLLQSVMDTLSSRESSCEPTFSSLLSPSPPPPGGDDGYRDDGSAGGVSRKESVASSTSSYMTSGSQLTVLRGGADRDETPPTLPSYSEAFNMSRRTRSYDRLPATPLYSTPLMTSGLPTSNTNTSLARDEGVVMVTVRLTKGEKGLGFSISWQRRQGKDGDVLVGDIQPGGVAEKDGRIRKGDQIVSINGQKIGNISYSTVVALLQQAKGTVELTLLHTDEATPSPSRAPPPNYYDDIHRRPVTTSPPHPLTTPTAPKVIPPKQQLPPQSPPPQSPPTQAPPSNRTSTADYKHILSIEVDEELGFSIISKDGATFVHVISPGSKTERDGKLLSGDQILSVNGQDVFGYSHSSVLDILQSVKKQPDKPVKLVVSRSTATNEDEADNSFSDIDSSSSDTEVVEVDLMKPSNGKGGLGISINALVNDHTEEDKGIYIRSVHPTGPAGLSGAVCRKDRIISVNNQPLTGLTNKEAAKLLRTAGQSVRLRLRRKRREKEEELKRGGVMEGAGPVINNDKTGQVEVRDEVGGEGGREIRSPLSPSVVQWSNILGSDKEIITAYINKVGDSKGLGFGMESIAVVDDTGQTEIGSIRHIIKSIREGGPMDTSSDLRIGDEILQVDGQVLVGLTHERATEVVREATNQVKLIVCRTISAPSSAHSAARLGQNDDNESEQVSPIPPISSSVLPPIEVHQATTSESEDDHTLPVSLATSPSPVALQATAGLYQNFSRFERQSWRERHNEETRRLKQQFELRREHYNRFLQQQEDELERVEREREERRTRQEEEKYKNETAAGEKRSSLQSGLHYSYYAPMSFLSLHESGEGGSEGGAGGGVGEEEDPVKAERGSSSDGDTNNRDSMASEESSTSTALSPVPGSAWENSVTVIKLIKGREGLGFSILNFADESSPGDTVTLVHSLVSGGAAERDGRLQKGDKLISINGLSVVNKSLDFTVGQLKSVPLNGTVVLGINRRELFSPDFDSTATSNSFSPDSLLDSRLEEEEEEEEERERKPAGTIHTHVRSEPDDITPYPDLPERRSVSATQDLRSATPPDSVKPKMETQSGLHFLSRTRSDEPARQADGIPGVAVVGHSLKQVESTSEETLVGSSSHQDLHLSSNQPSPKQQASPLMKVKPPQRDSSSLQTQLSNSSKASSSVTTSTVVGGERGGANIFSPSQSQDSFVESGLSPDTSDTGDHSAESIETEPMEVDIRKGSAHLGLAVMEDKGFIVVKKIESGSALAKDGRIRVGDRILAINGKSVEGLSIAKVKSMLKRASSTKSTKVKITYLPVPQGFSMGYSNINTGGTTSATDIQGVVPAGTGAAGGRFVIPGHTGIGGHQMTNLTNQQQQQQQQQHGGMMSTHNYQWIHYNTLPPLHPPHSHPHPPPVQYNIDHAQPGIVKPHPQAPPPLYDMYQVPSRPGPAGYHHPLNWNMPGGGVGGTGGGAGGGDYTGAQTQTNWRMGAGTTNQYPGNAPTGNEYHYAALSHKFSTMRQTELERQQMTRLPQQLPPPPMYNTDSYSFSSYSPQRYDGDYDHPTGRMYREQDGSGGHWSHDGMMYGPRMGGAYIDHSQPRMVEVKRNASGSLGISLGSTDGGGVVINAISPACQSMTKGQLVPGDKILEVNGIDLRNAAQTEAISIIMNCGNPVHLLVQTYTPPHPHPPPLHSIQSTGNTSTTNGASNNGGKIMRVHTSPLHSNDGSWAIDEEEDEELRQAYPYASGHLYQVTLNKGQGGLGLSICKTNSSPNSGVSIMQIHPGSVADRIRKIKRGDELIQVNEHCIKGLSQKEVLELLSRTSVLVNLVLMRPTPDPKLTHQSSTHSLDGGQYLNKQPSVDLTGLPLVKAINLERDDELGLGFAVSEADFNGQTGVRVSSISQRGPADLDGQLQVGDYILSIDGYNVLGTKYERATHLLQQARSSGSVSLIVSSQSQLPSQLQEQFLGRDKPQKHKRNMDQKRKRVRSEGVTLRNRVTKAQRSTRRRPVSVDCEIKFESTSKTDDTEQTRLDMDLLTSATTDQAVIVGKETDIELFKGEQPLGLSLTDSWQDGIIISSIQPRSPAAIDGRLKIGDRITRIGDISLDNASKEMALKLLHETPPLVQLTVYRFSSSSSDASSSPGGSGSTAGSREKSRSRSRENEVEIVDLLKPEHGGLGLMILEDEVDGGVYIEDVIHDEVADKCGRIHPGDKILAINGEDISLAGQDFVSSLLQSCRGRVSLTILHTVCTNTQLYSSVQSPTKKTPAVSSVYNPSSPPIRLQRPHDPPPYASSETTPMRLEPSSSSSYQDTNYHHHGVIPQTQYRDVVGQSLPESAPPPPTSTLQQYNNNRELQREGYQPDHHRANIRYVTLKRGPKGLGFSVAGGKGSPNGDLPICIRTISSECTAARDGRIRQGDIILSVNGISFENISHKVAVETLTRFHGDITLKISSS